MGMYLTNPQTQQVQLLGIFLGDWATAVQAGQANSYFIHPNQSEVKIGTDTLKKRDFHTNIGIAIAKWLVNY